jgi:hypothetical protein
VYYQVIVFALWKNNSVYQPYYGAELTGENTNCSLAEQEDQPLRQQLALSINAYQ